MCYSSIEVNKGKSSGKMCRCTREPADDARDNAVCKVRIYTLFCTKPVLNVIH